MGLNALLKNMTRKETKTAPVKSAAKKSKWKMVEVDGAVYAVKKTLSQLVDGQKVVGDLVIPERVGDLPVRSIAEKAFFGNKKIETVIIPPQVRKLGASAFEGCKALKIVDHPGRIELIDERAFAGCTQLTTVFVPGFCKEIGSGAFSGCTALKKISHHVYGGVSSKAYRTRFNDDRLPSSIERIGAFAFNGCTSLEEISIPYDVTVIEEGTFAGCTSLKRISLHSELKSIEKDGLSGCTQLKEIRLTKNLTNIGENALSGVGCIITEGDTFAAQYAKENGIDFKEVMPFTDEMDSRMIPIREGGREYQKFYTNEQMEKAEETFSTRSPVDYCQHNEPVEDIRASRYQFNEGEYFYDGGKSGKATIRMTGDLICRFTQQEAAATEQGFDFNAAFSGVKKLFEEADLTIGNLESTISDSAPYMSEVRYVDDRASYNAPKAFLKAIRNNGFDMIINAQNHIYDVGMRGVWETLDASNECQLMHTGVFASKNEKRYTIVNVNGIKLAIVAFMDHARQKMKRINFTDAGIDAMFSYYDKEYIESIMKEAREAGAEFIIAYCHWGREYTEKITERQNDYAHLVAEAGADYILGSHSHCPQPRTIIRTADGRQVPCIYSAGNFISDNSIELPITRDTYITTLCLEKDNEGKIQMVDEYYHPCRITIDEEVLGRVVVKTCEDMIKEADVAVQIEGEEAVHRISYTLGKTFKLKCDALKLNDDSRDEKNELSQYIVSQPTIARIFPEAKKTEEKRFIKDENGIYRRERDMGVNEAILCLAGQLSYDEELEKSSVYGDVCQFREGFRYVPACVKGADLVIGNLNTASAKIYPTTGKVGATLGNGYLYCNADPGYLDAVGFAGFNCLAAANPHNLDCGVEGVKDTIRAMEEQHIIPSGLGFDSKPIFAINGIKIAVLSYTVDCPNYHNVITQEGADLLLSIYSKARVESDIKAVREKGAEFVLVYVNSWSEDGKVTENLVVRHAREIANAGADYMVYTRPDVISKYTSIKADDGRIVPLMTSLGTFFAGKISDDHDETAMIKLVIRKDSDGKTETVANYIPFKRFKYLRGTSNLVGPAMKHYNPDFDSKDYVKVKSKLEKLIGEKLPINEERKVTLGSHYRPQISPKELCELLGSYLTKDEIAKLGDLYEKPVSRIVTRKLNINEGSVAVMVPQKTTPRDQITVSSAIEKGAVLLIATKKSKKIPTIVVDDDLMDVYMKIIGAIRDNYDPVTVAITGTVGKTTTKELISFAFDNHFKSLHIEGNHNTVYTVGMIVQKLSKSDGAFVQEVHGGTLKSCGRISKAIKPDICVVTAIGEGHLGQLGTMENVINEKMSIIDGMKEGGVLIINDDNEYLHNQHPDVNIIRYSMHDKNCDYYAQNIQAVEDRITFQICCEEGVYDAVLNFQGLHNVSNALATFAAGRAAGIPPHRIISGMARYIPEDDRQNLMEINGYRIIVDSYSSTPLSVRSAVDTLCALSIPEGGRRIAVVADIPDQGEDAVKNHFEVGKAIGTKDFDVLLCCGDLSRHIVAGAKEQGKEAYFFEKRDTFNKKIIEIMRPNDIILFKAGTRVHLKEQTIIPIFGDIVS